MVNIIVGIILFLVIGTAVRYLHHAKKRGVKCVGCPAGGTCSGTCGGHSKDV